MILPVQLEGLRYMKRWVCYNETKKPMNPITGEYAKANQEETWTTYDEALVGLEKFNFKGVGIQFGLSLEEALEVERLTGIDLDHVLHDGVLEPFALEIIRQMNSYTEISPSGNGIHILFKAKMPDTGRRRCVCTPTNPTRFTVETYNHSRYFTVTGNIYGEAKDIASRTEEFRSFCEEYFGDEQTTLVVSPVSSLSSSVEEVTSSVSDVQETNSSSSKKSNKDYMTDSLRSEYFSAEDLSDSELLEKMFSSSIGYRIRSLFDGDISNYPSQSEADLALTSYLAYWTNGDVDRMDDLFRQSELMREKWDERHGAQAYGAMTIAKALSKFQPYVKVTPLSHMKFQSNSQTQLHTSVSRENVENVPVGSNPESIVSNISVDEKVPELVPISSIDVKSYIAGAKTTRQIRGDLDRFRKFANRKTGFSNIDEKVSFYPGLYVLGAISSLGKTTFIHQMADQLVKAGEHVLFFSLEQTCLEIVTKGISRLMAEKNLSTAVSAIDIRRGVENNSVLKAMEEYASFTEHEIILECNFATTIADIVNTVEEYINKTSVTPIVVIDYLQVICPIDPRQTTKDAVDMHVRALKNFKRRKI